MLTIAPRPTGWRHAREVASDLLIGTALIWALPLLFGAAAALLTRLLPR